MKKVKTILIGAALVTGLYMLFGSVSTSSNPTDITKNAVMIVNKAMNHGGTGIIYQSKKEGTLILTNDHVCRAISNGGFVKTTENQYQVQSMLESQVSDLCLVYVPSNLKQNTKVATESPETFSPEKVSGHPALMPTVISSGHFSERNIITVMTGTRPCTAEDANDPLNSLYCGFFGVVPVLKSYESVLVTSTIMPGSSGSGVYNSNNELSGVVFAGQGDFGYAWIVPHDQVVQFLNKETITGKWKTIDQTLNQSATEEGKKTTTKELLKKCVNATKVEVLGICSVLKRDVMWVK